MENQEEQPIIIKKIIKKVGHGAAHGGAWKVAYADFVTAMMCLFLLLWLVNVDPSSKAAVSSFFKQPTTSGPMEGNIFIFGGAKKPTDPGKFDGGASFLDFQKLIITEKNKEEIRKLLQKELQKELEKSADEELLNRIEFNLVETGILIELKDSEGYGTFNSGSASLSTQARLLVDKLALLLANRISPIVVSGFTDGSKFSYGNYDNWNLSTDRAIAVKSRLAFGGVNTTRFAKVEGYADTQLKNPELPMAAANRRITILLLQDGEKDKLLPKYIYKQDELGKEVKNELKQHSELKRSGSLDTKQYSDTGAKQTTPLSLEEIRRKKAREVFRQKYPSGTAASSSGHGAEPEDSNETEPETEAESGGHGGGGHGGGH
jgi:chemotaxis protein MotB